MSNNIVVYPAKKDFKKITKDTVKKLAVNIALGVVGTVVVTLISGAILNKIQPGDVEADN